MSSTGSFLSATYNSLGAQVAVSCCCASCSNQGPYHRHCGCPLHSAYCKFDGNSSPKCQVKISNKKTGSGGMFRSISVQNLGDKSLCVSNSSSSSSETHSPFDESTFERRQDEDLKTSLEESNLTVLLMEELATLIQEMKGGGMNSEEMYSDDDARSLVNHQT